ncbi:MAG: GtrA family protein [Burkholderiaceae bacterium]|jgi:putative flippase GtrA|nr:GtrA family protein [Burkholderiaceae bacterium]
MGALVKPSPALRSALWFLVIGCAAALTHFAVFTFARRVIPPDVANPVGFIVAFWVSFFGHRHLSFTDAGTTVGQSLWRFAVTSVAGFAGNELFFEAFYRGLHWLPSWAWFAAAVLAAGQTFVLSRFWAFRR